MKQLASGHHLGFLPTPAVRFGEGTLPVSIFVSIRLYTLPALSSWRPSNKVCVSPAQGDQELLGSPRSAWTSVEESYWPDLCLKQSLRLDSSVKDAKKQPILSCEMHHDRTSLAPQVANSLLLLGIFLILDRGYTADKVVLEFSSSLRFIKLSIFRWCALSICQAHLFQHASCGFQLPSWMLG